MSLDRRIAPDPYDYLPLRPWFSLTSRDLTEGATMSLEHVHTSAGGRNVSPHLEWSGAPPQSQSFAVTCFDPDAPTGCGYWHWSVIDIPAQVSEFARGIGAGDDSLPWGSHALTDFGTPEYAGAAPPPGDRAHRYMFVVHAVDVPRLGVEAGGSPVDVAFTLAFHTLARARLTVTFAR